MKRDFSFYKYKMFKVSAKEKDCYDFGVSISIKNFQELQKKK